MEVIFCMNRLPMGVIQNWHSKRYPFWNSNLSVGAKNNNEKNTLERQKIKFSPRWGLNFDGRDRSDAPLPLRHRCFQCNEFG